MTTTSPTPDQAEADATRAAPGDDAVRPSTSWPMERVLFAMAGTVILSSIALATFVSPWFLLLTAFVGVSQWMYVVAGSCPASLILRRFGIEPQCSW